jgi:hypothetical protein
VALEEVSGSSSVGHSHTLRVDNQTSQASRKARCPCWVVIRGWERREEAP